MKILVDMNLSPEWVDLLRQQGMEAEHWSTVGTATASDKEILHWAQAGGYVVLTHDLDFGDLLAASGAAKPSVVLLRSQSVQVETVGGRVVSQLRASAADLERGAVLVIDTARSRVRVLPIR